LGHGSLNVNVVNVDSSIYPLSSTILLVLRWKRYEEVKLKVVVANVEGEIGVYVFSVARVV
jgi:hypothetical protein